MDDPSPLLPLRGVAAYWSRGLRLPRLVDRMGLPFELREGPGAGRQTLRIRVGAESVGWALPCDLARVGFAPVRVVELREEAAEGAEGGGRPRDEGVCVVGRGMEAADFFRKCHLRGRLALALHGARVWGTFLLRREPLRGPGPAAWRLRRLPAGDGGGGYAA